MIGKAPNAILKAGAIGTMMNTSTYGMKIPLIYGTVRASVYAIWAANLRQGGGKKGKSKKGKSAPTYVENIDFLIGHNPIGGTLQFWDNNNQLYPLAFEKYTYRSE